MKKILVDGRFMEDEESAEIYLAEIFALEKQGGNLLDSLWDYLAYEDYPTRITVIGTSRIISNLGGYGSYFIDLLLSINEESPGISVELDILS